MGGGWRIDGGGGWMVDVGWIVVEWMVDGWSIVDDG